MYKILNRIDLMVSCVYDVCNLLDNLNIFDKCSACDECIEHECENQGKITLSQKSVQQLYFQGSRILLSKNIKKAKFPY